jgi:hypothetical protein
VAKTANQPDCFYTITHSQQALVEELALKKKKRFVCSQDGFVEKEGSMFAKGC